MSSATPAAVAAPRPDHGLDRELMLVAWVVVLGAIMSILDVTVVNVASTHRPGSSSGASIGTRRRRTIRTRTPPRPEAAAPVLVH